MLNTPEYSQKSNSYSINDQSPTDSLFPAKLDGKKDSPEINENLFHHAFYPNNNVSVLVYSEAATCPKSRLYFSTLARRTKYLS
jgi:hypothetical protein